MNGEERLRISDGRDDFEAVTDNPPVGQESLQVLGAVARNPLRVEPVERPPVVLALLQDGQPREPGLRSLQDKELEELAIVVFGETPLFVMVLHEEGVVPGPIAPSLLADRRTSRRHAAQRIGAAYLTGVSSLGPLPGTRIRGQSVRRVLIRDPCVTECSSIGVWATVKYYNEDQMKEVRQALEADMVKWPGVASKEMMGCLCYFRGKKFFAFFVTSGLVITKLSKDDRSNLAERVAWKPFEMSGRVSSSWMQVTVKKPGELPFLLPYVRKSYEAASP